MFTIDELIREGDCHLDDPIGLAASGGFRWGNYQARVYDPASADFEQPFLYSLYEKTRLSGQRHPKPLDLADRGTLGLLQTLYCGMTNLGPDSICAYLSQRAVCVVGEWRREFGPPVVTDDDEPVVKFGEEAERFHPLGYCFPSTQVVQSSRMLTGVPSNAVFAGYTLFSECWRTPQQVVLMYLGLAWLFHTFKLEALHGSRYADNHLTARWTRQFGFRDHGTMPFCLEREPGGPLISATFSTLLREDLEAQLRKLFESARRATPSVSG